MSLAGRRPAGEDAHLEWFREQAVHNYRRRGRCSRLRAGNRAGADGLRPGGCDSSLKPNATGRPHTR
jgi:hypothetical protein